MSENLDFTRLPTEGEIIRLKNEVHMTEKRLEMLKAWIAPIRRLNIDILSLIFEICGKDDWKTTLRISATSREWRNLVLATPRAWGFFPLEKCPDIETTKRYLELSHPRPLHLYVPDAYVNPLLSSISQRLECLTLNKFEDDRTELSFPKLKRLAIVDEGDFQLSRIDATRSPALRHLECVDCVTPLIDGDLLNFPPVQSLSFMFDSDSCWLRVLQACQDTLISLQFITGELQTTIPKPQLVFPRLLCLQIEDWLGHSGGSPLDLKTPALETYIEYTDHPGGSLMRPDAKTVTQLRTNQAAELSAFPRARIIQLRDKREVVTLLQVLLSDPAHFSDLETIEAAPCNDVDDMLEWVEAVNKTREQAISLDFTSWSRDLHGMINTQICFSNNTPCF